MQLHNSTLVPPDLEEELYSSSYLENYPRLHAYIQNYWLTNGLSPTLKQITKDLNYSSKSVPLRWLRQMRANGHLLFEDDIARSFRLPGQTVTFPD